MDFNLMGKDNLLFLRRLHGQFHEWKLQKKKQFYFWRYLTFPLGKKVYLMGTPVHSNVGDSAIALAEKEFLKNCGYKETQIKEITYKEYKEDGGLISPHIKNQYLVCLHGGGNMGDEWIHEEYFRRKVLDDFKMNPKIIFPQTIFYSKTEFGQQEKQNSVKYYNEDKQMIIIAREQKSFEIMQELYPDVKCMLTPDIVLSVSHNLFELEPVKRSGALLCMRNDPEKALTDEEVYRIQGLVMKLFREVRRTDMHSNESISKESRKRIVCQKLREFSESEIVITDRLHGMVFSAISGTPCIVFSNYNQKVQGTYEWIKSLPYIRFVQSVEEVEGAIKELMNTQDYEYDNSTWIHAFDELKQKIETAL